MKLSKLVIKEVTEGAYPLGTDKRLHAIKYIIRDENLTDKELKNLYYMASGEGQFDQKNAKKNLDKISHRLKYIVDGFGLNDIKNIVGQMLEESFMVNSGDDNSIEKQYAEELEVIEKSIEYCKDAIKGAEEAWEKKEYQEVLKDHEARKKEINGILAKMKKNEAKESKKEKLISFIKHQLNIDITPHTDDKWSKKNTYLNVDMDKLDDLEQRKIRSLAHSSKKFKIESNGGAGEAFYYTDALMEAAKEVDDVIGKTKSGKEVHRAFSNSAHSSFTKEDHEDAAKINRSKINLKMPYRQIEQLRHNEKMHSMAAKEADKKDDKKDDGKEDKLAKAFANIDKQFGKK